MFFGSRFRDAAMRHPSREYGRNRKYRGGCRTGVVAAGCYNGVMVELKVLTLIVMNPGSPSFLVLEPLESHAFEGKSRVVPICIGTHEAMGLGAVLEDMHFNRPTTHDLMMDALTNLDARIDSVLIHDVKDDTFYAQLTLAQYDRLITLDSRPSDAIALALRQEAPIYIEDAVLERASFPYLICEPIDEEQVVNDFKNFLNDISPEDFA